MCPDFQMAVAAATLPVRFITLKTMYITGTRTAVLKQQGIALVCRGFAPVSSPSGCSTANLK
jgi:hypothetical protein